MTKREQQTVARFKKRDEGLDKMLQRGAVTDDNMKAATSPMAFQDRQLRGRAENRQQFGEYMAPLRLRAL
jgi:hypothetical protein